MPRASRRRSCPAACASASALARALALEPEILFLDEPTSGLDPIGAREFNRLVRVLAESLGLTVYIVTHDLELLRSITDRVIALAAGRVVADGPVDTVRSNDIRGCKTTLR